MSNAITEVQHLPHAHSGMGGFAQVGAGMLRVSACVTLLDGSQGQRSCMSPISNGDCCHWTKLKLCVKVLSYMLPQCASYIPPYFNQISKTTGRGHAMLTP